MKSCATFKILKLILFLILSSCAQFQEIDRTDLSRPSMSLQKPIEAPALSALTNQKSSQGFEVSSCTVCSH